MSKLATNLQDRRQPDSGSFENLLVIFDLRTAQTEIIDRGPDAFAVPQCWCQMTSRLSIELTRPVEFAAYFSTTHGQRPPKRLQMAVLEPRPPMVSGLRTFFVRLLWADAHITGFTPQPACKHSSSKLIPMNPAYPGLPIRFVAYASAAGLFEREMVREAVRLRVRRLEDNAEYRVPTSSMVT